MRATTLLLSLLLATPAFAEGWLQWGRNARHDSRATSAGQDLHRIEAEIVLDPFVEAEKASVNGVLLVHYQVPIVEGNDLYLVVKSGQFTGNTTRETQIWNVRNVRRSGSTYTTRWTWTSDWKPVPSGGNVGPRWEPVYHTAVTRDAVWAPGAGGTIDKISKETGQRIARYNPFGTVVDSSIFMAGPPVADDAGNLYYNALQLEGTNPWTTDVRGAWLVRVGADGTVTRATFASLTPGAPTANERCNSSFINSQLPWPPAVDAVPPTTPCGSQRPGINVTPAVGPDGTVYTVSRAHLNDRYSYVIAANSDLTRKWSTSLRNRFNDGCNVLIPPNGSPGGCRAGATTGVDPAENQPGSGRVSDDGTSSPVVLPDGNVLYGAYTRYNFSQGHLMMFDSAGNYLRAYEFGWDITPAFYEHDGTYSIVMKENRYAGSAYCGGNAAFCPPNRTANTPNDPEAYYITQLDPQFRVKWKYRNTETKSCERNPDGSVTCVEERPNGFEWCVNAIAVDNRGVIYANAEDGNLYAFNPNGTVRQRLFLRLALGAAYTPLSIGEDGRIYTQNDGRLFVVVGPPRRRAVGF